MTVTRERVIEDPTGEFARVRSHLEIGSLRDPDRPRKQIGKLGVAIPPPDTEWRERLSGAIEGSKRKIQVSRHRRKRRPRCPRCGHDFKGIFACAHCGILPEALTGSYRLANVASFPKSGRTWFAHLYYYTLANFDSKDIDFGFTYKPQLRAKFQRLLAREGQNDRYPLVSFTHAGSRAAIAGKRLVQKIENLLKIPTLLLVRDPKDVIVSYFHHSPSKGYCPTDSLSEFIRDRRFGVQRIVEFLNAWAPHHRADHPNLEVLTYEELKEDTTGSLAVALRFLGVDPQNLMAVEYAVQQSAFEPMRARELDARRKSDPSRASTGDLRMRAGIQGGYRQEMTEADIHYVSDILRNHLDPMYGNYLNSDRTASADAE